jgi:hypothetical protein
MDLQYFPTSISIEVGIELRRRCDIVAIISGSGSPPYPFH